jgi:hypothetical protein
LTTESPYIEMTDSTEAYGDFASEEYKSVED